MLNSTTKFATMLEATADDYKVIGDHNADFFKSLPDRIFSHLRLLANDTGGFPVDRLTHCLQTATRAHRDGRDDEYVICALLHDIGDTLATSNHAEMAAVLLKPFVTEKNHWIVDNHGIFQGYYFFHHLGLDRNMRDQFKGHPWFEACAEFCAKYDQNSFDRDYDSLPLEYFEPMMTKIFASPKKSIYRKVMEQE